MAMPDFDHDPFGPDSFQFDPFLPAAGQPLRPGDSFTVTGSEAGHPPLIEPVDSGSLGNVQVSFELPPGTVEHFEVTYSPPAPLILGGGADQRTDTEMEFSKPPVDDGWVDLRKLNAFHPHDPDPPSLDEFPLRPYDASKTVKRSWRPAPIPRPTPRRASPQEQPACPACGEAMGFDYHCQRCNVWYCPACLKCMTDGCCTNRSCPAYAEPCDLCGTPIPSANLSGQEPDVRCDRCGRKVCQHCGSLTPLSGGFPPTGYSYLCLDCLAQCEEEFSQQQRQQEPMEA
jgi:hypothetical protein